MKTRLQAAGLLCGVAFIVFSCTKADNSAALPKEQLVLGKWSINRIQQKIYTNGVFVKDTILKQTPKPQNFVNFTATGNFEYRFNNSKSDTGIYRFSGYDSVLSVTPAKTYRWKTLTLTNVLFTVKSTSSSDPVYPGSVVETYHTLVR